MLAITGQQQAIYDFIKNAVAASRPCPSQREIANHFGFASKTAAVDHMKALVKKGLLVVLPGKARSVQLVNVPPAASQNVFEIPLFGSIPAGFGREREQEDDECIPVTMESIGFKPTRNTFALRVVGDSMIGRQILDGDIVVLEQGPEPRPEEVVAAFIDQKSTLKTFVVEKGKPFLRAENPRFPNLIPSEELTLQGVFRALIRKANR